MTRRGAHMRSGKMFVEGQGVDIRRKPLSSWEPAIYKRVAGQARHEVAIGRPGVERAEIIVVPSDRIRLREAQGEQS